MHKQCLRLLLQHLVKYYQYLEIVWGIEIKTDHDLMGEAELKMKYHMMKNISKYPDKTHLVVSNDSDMFKAAGYIGARDRLFQMSFMKYAYKGHLSLVLNDSLIVEDTFLRTLGFEKIANYKIFCN